VVKDYIGSDEPTSKSDEKRQIKNEEIEKVFEDEDFLIMIPKTERASCLIGKGTQWCTAADKSNNMFNSYNNQGPLYVIIDKDNNNKYQLHFETNQLMDAEDRSIGGCYFFEEIVNDSVFDFLQTRYERFWDFILETSVEDIVYGGYCEMFTDALSSEVTPSVLSDVLSKLRGGNDSSAIYTGFVYEKDPNEIDNDDLVNLFDNEYIDPEDLEGIMSHLEAIKYDFENYEVSDNPVSKYREAMLGLSKNKLEIGINYQTDKGRELIINKINIFNPEKPYNITVNKETGNVDIETLVNYIHQGQLFESKSIIKKLLRKSLIAEGISDITYHFNYINSTNQILKSNKINLTAAFGTTADNNLNKGKLFFLSTTSSRSSNVGYAASLGRKNLVRITLNARLLSQNYKVNRVDYWQRPKDPKHPMYNPTDKPRTDKEFYRYISRQDELEDRFISDKNEITPANKYIISIETLNGDPEKIEDTKFLCDKLNIPFFAYDNEAYFDASAKSKAINVTGKESESKPENSQRVNTDLIAYLGFKDEALKEKIYNNLADLGIADIDTVKKYVEARINDKLNYYLRTNDDYYINDFARSMDAEVHNNRSSSNEVNRYLIRQLGLDMKKYRVNNVKDYLKYKVWKGKKTQKDFSNELIKKINVFIDNALKENRQYLNLNNKSVEYNGEYYDNILQTPVGDYLNNFILNLKKYYKDYIINNDDMFRNSYILAREYVVKDLGLSKEKILTDLNPIFNDIDLTYSNVNIEEIYNIIFYVMSDLDRYSYAEIKKMQEESQNQWRDN
jgi:hypothetical protein